MDKKKAITIGVALVCLVAAGVIVAMQFGLFSGKKDELPKPVNAREEANKDPAVKKALEEVEERQEKALKTQPAAGS